MTTWFITGCSTGLGRATAEAALARGANVVVTARDTRSVEDLTGAYPRTALALLLDVSDKAQATTAVGRAVARFGSIDVLVNNAGHGYRAAVEEGVDAEVDQLFATNFFGPRRPDQGRPPGHAHKAIGGDRQRLVHRGSARQRWLGLLCRQQGSARTHVRCSPEGGRAARDQGDRG
jgi:NAD(P)-dependent dehydrogenase (short-subunit alcohol dehydrogenase family)